jgi:hypothetical protein
MSKLALSDEERSPESVLVFAKLEEHGLLLQLDSNLPNVCALVAGERVRGSWWSHPSGRAIFAVAGELADHPDVLMTKLISGKVTYVHRPLWPQVIAVGRAREPWQIKDLSPAGRKLLAQVDRKPVEPDSHASKAASELEARLLVYSEQFHSESGAHVRRLESWDHWSRRIGDVGEETTAVRGRRFLEDVVAPLNRKFKGSGRLPWQAKRL